MSNCPSGKQWQLAGDPPDTLEKIGECPFAGRCPNCTPQSLQNRPALHALPSGDVTVPDRNRPVQAGLLTG